MKDFDALVVELNKQLVADGTILRIMKDTTSGSFPYYWAEYSSYELLEVPNGMRSVPPVGQNFMSYVNKFFKAHDDVKIAFTNACCFYCVDQRYCDYV